MTDKSSEAFEAWYQADIVNWSQRFNREPDGKYSFRGTEKAWQAWQASREAMNAKPTVIAHEYGDMPNVGHGHVFPRADGMLAKCGGPAMCIDCQMDATTKRSQQARFTPE